MTCSVTESGSIHVLLPRNCMVDRRMLFISQASPSLQPTLSWPCKQCSVSRHPSAATATLPDRKFFGGSCSIRDTLRMQQCCMATCQHLGTRLNEAIPNVCLRQAEFRISRMLAYCRHQAEHYFILKPALLEAMEGLLVDFPGLAVCGAWKIHRGRIRQ